MGAMGIPLLNTIILLTSGVHADDRAPRAQGRQPRRAQAVAVHHDRCWASCSSASRPTSIIHAYIELNLKLSTGVYGSTFFMLTGFHGLHVTIGAIMLTVMLFRVLKGHFDAEHHFAFEAAAWYWHFVDVVWLLLFVLVYWLV